MRKLLLVITIIFSFSQFCFSAENSDTSSFDDVEFPQWAKDVRRTEIITFGSLPFVTLWTTLGYSLAVYGEFRNPLNKSTDSFTVDDQKKIMAMSAGICVGLGAVDLAITLIKRATKKKSLKSSDGSIFVTAISNDEQTSENESKNSTVEKSETQTLSKQDYLIEGVVEDAVF